MRIASGRGVTVAEEWRAIPGWEGYYEASTEGRIRSLPRQITNRGLLRDLPGVVLAACPNAKGRPQVRLRRDGEGFAKQVHALILETFIGPRPDGMQACHNDGDVLNNRLTNLRWDTPRANNLDTIRHGRHKGASKTHCVRGHPFSGDNLVLKETKSGTRRRCRECDRAAFARANERAKQRGTRAA